MIIRENIGSGIIRAYSDQGVKIHGGFPEADYDITYYPEEANRTYVETNIPVDQPISEYIGGPKQYSKVKILLVPTNEELMIARDTYNIVNQL